MYMYVYVDTQVDRKASEALAHKLSLDSAREELQHTQQKLDDAQRQLQEAAQALHAERHRAAELLVLNTRLEGEHKRSAGRQDALRAALESERARAGELESELLALVSRQRGAGAVAGALSDTSDTQPGATGTRSAASSWRKQKQADPLLRRTDSGHLECETGQLSVSSLAASSSSPPPPPPLPLPLPPPQPLPTVTDATDVTDVTRLPVGDERAAEGAPPQQGRSGCDCFAHSRRVTLGGTRPATEIFSTAW